MNDGPVEAAFTVYEDFENYAGGIYSNKGGQMLGGHAVRIVGWGVDSGTPYDFCISFSASSAFPVLSLPFCTLLFLRTRPPPFLPFTRPLWCTGRYWKIANSWNKFWGEKGFFRMLRGVNECGIETQVTTATGNWKKTGGPSPIPTPPPTPPTPPTPADCPLVPKTQCIALSGCQWCDEPGGSYCARASGPCS